MDKLPTGAADLVAPIVSRTVTGPNDLAQLLDVEVEEFAGMLPLVAYHWRRGLQGARSGESVAPEQARDGGAGEAAGISQWPAQNIAIAPMTIATDVAAIFIKNRWVQILALAIQIGGWIWYSAGLQTAVSG